MSAPAPHAPKNRYLPLIVGLVGVAVVLILGIFICVLFVQRGPVERRVAATTAPTATPTPTQPAFPLPTAPLPTATSGPPMPKEVIFAAQEPLKGFSSCTRYGFKGSVTTSNGTDLKGVQIVVWEDETGFLALDTTDANGHYSIEIQDAPARRKLWVQIYQHDIPVSLPVLVETHVDCQTGFQIYQIDWQQATE